MSKCVKQYKQFKYYYETHLKHHKLNKIWFKKLYIYEMELISISVGIKKGKTYPVCNVFGLKKL